MQTKDVVFRNFGTLLIHSGQYVLGERFIRFVVQDGTDTGQWVTKETKRYPRKKGRRPIKVGVPLRYSSYLVKQSVRPNNGTPKGLYPNQRMINKNCIGLLLPLHDVHVRCID